MRYTRCEACGAKALLACSQCPKCGHLLGLRNSRGVPFPLSHCRTCDSYYPSDRGTCRWCGTTAPPRSRWPRYVWGGVGVAVVAGASLGAWAVWKGRLASPAETLGAPVATMNTEPSAAQRDSFAVPSTLALDSAAAPAATPVPDAVPRNAPGDSGIQAPPSTGSLEAEIRWVTATATTWANVRSDASRQSAIVAVISPDTRVRLGDARDGWYRVKAGGIEGWVDRRLFTIDAPVVR